MRVFATFISVAVLTSVVVYALGPANWAFRTGLGWQIEHFLGYFAVTSIMCFAWQRPLIIGGGLMVGAPLLEGLQGLTPDRFPDLWAAFYSAAGVLTAAVLFVGLTRALGRQAVSK